MSKVILSEQSSVPSTPASGKVAIYVDNTATPRLILQDDLGDLIPQATLINSSVTSVSAGYAADTYLAGSSIIIPAGKWRAKQQYRCKFDMTKTAAGIATPIITLRMGTLGTTGDAAIQTITFGAGTALADTGVFEVLVTFRTIGSGTSAVTQAVAKVDHHLGLTGLTSTGAVGTGIILGTSAGFNSTTQTTIGLSFNGGASFSGTCTLVQAELLG